MAVGLALIVGACDGGGGSAPTTSQPSAVPDSAAAVRRNVDGHLRLGVWLPASGAAELLGTPLLAGVELAVRLINEAGGVNGQLLEVVNRDEGSDPATAAEALSTMLDEDQVDVIVGPASSRVALGALDVLADAQAVTCSPTATAVDLEQERDNGFFVRTIGSEALEAVALTSAMVATGNTMFAAALPGRRLRAGLRRPGAAGLPAAAGRGRPRLVRPDLASSSTGLPGKRWTPAPRWWAWWAPGRSALRCWRRSPPTTARPIASRRS